MPASPDASVVTLIGDVVGSRRSADRHGLHASLEAALASVNSTHAPAVPLALTVGDEYQGTFHDLGTALSATLHLRLALLPGADVRHGVGRGRVAELSTGPGSGPRIEDGPGWWAARAAIDEAKALAARAATRAARTLYVVAEDERPGASSPAVVNAALLGRDQLVGALTARSLGVLRGLLSGTNQRAIAEQEGISPSAVSQRVRHDGLGTVMAIEDMLREVR